MKNRNRAIAPVIIAFILIVAIVAAGAVVYIVVIAPKPGPGPGPGPSGFQITEIENYGDLVNYVSHIKYQWTSFEGGVTSIGTITFDDTGIDEMISGVLCRKFSLVITSDGETHSMTGWVSKSDWTTLKKLIYDDEEILEEYLSTYSWAIGAIVFLPYVTFFAWNIAWTQVPSDVGTLTSMGSEPRTYGATPMTVYKWRFTPNPANPEFEDLSSIDVWQGQTGNYYLFTYLEATKTNGDYFRFELVELTT
ncbi:MAG: hypothetical protein H3Z52_00460 [archaeon]|nr:hypothetical protein [archaeon]